MFGFKKGIYLYFKYVPLILLAVFSGQAIYGYLNPWTHFNSIVNEYPNSYFIHSGARITGASNSWTKSKDYIFIDKENFSSKTVTIKVSSSGKKNIKEQEGGFLSYILHMFFMGILVYFFWIHKNTHNKKRNGMDGSVEPPIR